MLFAETGASGHAITSQCTGEGKEIYPPWYRLKHLETLGFVGPGESADELFIALSPSQS